MSLRLLSARIQSRSTVLLTFSQRVDGLSRGDITFAPKIDLRSIDKLEHLVLLHTSPLEIRKSYNVFVRGVGTMPLIPDGILDEYISQKPLGCVRKDGNYIFRLFAPRAHNVFLILFATLDDDIGTEFEMSVDTDGVWELSLAETYVGKYYCYRVAGPVGPGESFNPDVAFADPYARAVVTRNNHLHQSRSQIVSESFDWEDDTWVCVPPGDLILYEAHVRDLTAHVTSGLPEADRGRYTGLARGRATGGLHYLKELGINAVELLPVMEFSNIEPPYEQLVEGGLYNTWNPYERNHWGYMTSFFFAPESWYASGTHLRPGGWCDADGRQIRELKELVRALHREGIAVIMDVVYNHTSQYDHQPLKLIDRRYYYHLDERAGFRSLSGCGNDFNTVRPMARRLLIESIEYWMEEFHIDGFRFDLAAMIDWDTIEDLIVRARAVNPDVILIAEPWGGGVYDLAGFSERGMAVWNDLFRNEVKGHNPHNGTGFIFGSWQGDPLPAFTRWVLGSTTQTGGPLSRWQHAVNYLEAHDGYTLGDFVRIAGGEAHADTVVTDLRLHVTLTDRQLRIHRLAAFLLFVCKGSVMIHAGQEFARSRVIAATQRTDTRPGRMDSNSYEKDDETNWINYEHAAWNAALVDYYRGLIEVRKAFLELRQSPDDAYRFFRCEGPLSCGFVLFSATMQVELFIVCVNASPDRTAVCTLPDGLWSLLVDSEHAGITVLRKGLSARIDVPPQSGVLLIREYETRFG